MVPHTPQTVLTQENTFSTSKAGYLEAMENLGIPVPPFFVLSDGQTIEMGGIEQEIKTLMIKSGKGWADAKAGWNGLFVSVRSSFGVSMPGMLDTVLNVGLTFEHAKYVNEEKLWRTYIKFVQKYGELVSGISSEYFPEIPERANEGTARKFEACFMQHAGYAFPQNANEQLIQAIHTVRKSWHNARAQAYRLHENVHSTGRVDVVIQVMVFGNRSERSGTGVLFTRNPSTGTKELFGEYLPQAQGEDIVSGDTNPCSIEVLKTHLPIVYTALKEIAEQLEQYFLDMQDIEFTIEHERLWILQTRSGKRTKVAELRILEAYVQEGLITTQEAFQRLSLKGIDGVFHSYLECADHVQCLGQGLAASPGAACGMLATHSASVTQFQSQNNPVIFAAQETHCNDVASIMESRGVMTATGGTTCHAAVVTRGLGKPCVTSVAALRVHQGSIEIAGQVIEDGTFITLDGNTGNIFLGEVPLCIPKRCQALDYFLALARQHSAISVYVNADTPEDWESASTFDPCGVGLCRSEHMFFQDTHLPWFQGFILGVGGCMERIAQLQEEDYCAMLTCVQGKRFTVRLLDPPLHEFLPGTPEAAALLAKKLGFAVADIMRLTEHLREKNPMLGQRGCRLALMRPEICDVQVNALFKAAERVSKLGQPVNIGIMIPFVMVSEEFVMLKRRIMQLAQGYDLRSVHFDIGVMIEIPSAVLQAGSLALEADFICFGTNDLTQMTLGLSRDDTAYVLQQYRAFGIMPTDPFQSIHQDSVGKMLSVACASILDVNPNMHISVCGEHGGDPESIRFFYSIGIGAVSCSPYRVPKAQLAGAKVSFTLFQENRMAVSS